MSVTRLSTAVLLMMIVLVMRQAQGQGKLIDGFYDTHSNTL